jgi:hypothetical protein
MLKITIEGGVIQNIENMPKDGVLIIDVDTDKEWEWEVPVKPDPTNDQCDTLAQHVVDKMDYGTMAESLMSRIAHDYMNCYDDFWLDMDNEDMQIEDLE